MRGEEKKGKGKGKRGADRQFLELAVHKKRKKGEGDRRN